MHAAEPTDAQGISDADLLAAFADRRESEALTELIRRHGPLVRAVCQRVLQNPHDTDDAFQATFLVLVRSARKIRQRRLLAAWLYGVAYRTARRLQRRRVRASGDGFEDHIVVNDDPLQRLSVRYDCEAAMREVYRLPIGLREPVILRYMQGLSHAEIAQQMKLTAEAVDGRLKRARRRLRYQLARQGISLGIGLSLLQVDAAEGAVTSELIAQTVQLCQSSGTGPMTGEHAAGPTTTHLAHQEIAMMTLLKTARWCLIGLASTTGALLVGASLLTSGRLVWGDQPAGGALELLSARSANNAPGDSAAFAVAQVDENTDGEATGPQPADEGDRQADQPQSTSPKDYLGRYDVTDLTPNEIRIERALREPTRLTFSNQPLESVINYVSQLHNIPVRLDPRSDYLAPDTPVTVNLDGIQLQNALDLLLEPLDATAVVDREVLLITDVEHADEKLTVRIYPLDPAWPMSVEDLGKAIQTLVQPDSWDEFGGWGTMETYNTADRAGLMIAANHNVHRKINELLAQLDRVSQGAGNVGSFPRRSTGPENQSRATGRTSADSTPPQPPGGRLFDSGSPSPVPSDPFEADSPSRGGGGEAKPEGPAIGS